MRKLFLTAAAVIATAVCAYAWHVQQTVRIDVAAEDDCPYVHNAMPLAEVVRVDGGHVACLYR